MELKKLEHKSSLIYLKVEPTDGSFPNLGSIRCKHNVRWQHLSLMKNVAYDLANAAAYHELIEFIVVYKILDRIRVR